MQEQIKRTILRALAAMGDTPMHQTSLETTCKVMVAPMPAIGDVQQAVQDLEAGGYIVGRTVELMGKFYSLTPKGSLKASAF